MEPESCLADNELQGLIEGALSADDRAHMVAHIQDCASCRELVAELARGDDVQPATLASSSGDNASSKRSILLPGERFGRYQIIGLLGRGGMAVVYQALDKQLDRTIALKLLRPELASPQLNARLLRESKALARLSHPNVVQVYDAGQIDGEVFVAMEHILGKTLDQWLLAESRSLPAILALFTSAGQGLQAAHEAGLVHRDFKPSNVLIADDGRVCVGDFGLARLVSGEEQDTQDSVSQQEDAEAAKPVTTSLTRSGIVVGTPAYMAPEQHDGSPDARSDQFSFCVALYEALFGERPFLGESASELSQAVREGPPPIPSRSQVPAHVHAAITCGLQPNPKKRFSSIAELLAALAPPRSHKRTIAGLVLAIGVAGGAVTMASTRADDRPACAEPREKLAQVWDKARQNQVRSALVVPGSEPSKARWTQVETALSSYTDRWLAMHVQACEETRRGAQSAELLDVRMHCLDSRLRGVAAATDLLANAEGSVADQALEVVDGLERLEACTATEALQTRPPTPTDSSTRTAVAAIRAELNKVTTLRNAGSYQRALETARPLLAQSQETGFRAVEAETLNSIGDLEVLMGRPRDGARTLMEAAHAATAGRHDLLAADTWILLVGVESDDLGHIERGEEYAEHARAAIERHGGNDVLQARLHHALGLLRRGGSMHEEAAAEFGKAIDLWKQIGDEEERLASLGGLGVMYEDLGRFDEAIECHIEVLEGWRKVFDADHPNMAVALTALASAQMQVGAPKTVDNFREALTIWERSLGPDHLDTARGHHNLGTALTRRGEFEEAIVQYALASEGFRAAVGEQHHLAAINLGQHGVALTGLEQYEEAATLLDKALLGFVATVGEQHIDTAFCHINMGEALIGLERHVEAGEQVAIGLLSLQSLLGTDHPYMAHGHYQLALVLYELDKLAGAAESMERAATLYHQLDPVDEADARFVLAQLEWDRGQRQRARSQAQVALELLPPGLADEYRAQVEAWLSELPNPK